MKKIIWKKYVARKIDLQKSIQFAHGTGYLQRFIKPDYIKHQLYYFDGRTTNIYFDKKDYEKFIKVIRVKLNDIKYVSLYEKKLISVCHSSLFTSFKISKKLDKSVDNKKLIDLFDKFNEIWKEFYPLAWMAFYLGELDEIVREKLKQKLDDDKKVDEAMEHIAISRDLSPVMNAEIDILRLAKLITENKQTIKFAKKMADKYGWMTVYNFEDTPRDYNFYLDEAKKIVESKINIAQKIEIIKKDRQNNEVEFQKLRKLFKNKINLRQIDLLHKLGYLRDMREEYRDRLTFYAKKLYIKIGEAINLSLSEVVNLTNVEIIELLSSNNKNNFQKYKQLTIQRLQSYVVLVNDKKVEVFDNEVDKKRYINSVKIKKNTKILNGNSAFGVGKKVVGKAKIVLSNKELTKIKQGDILVAAMTKPDFMIGIKKAAAIITDEGGITCHAAIVSRELKIPCIVGTRIATEVLKDGDIVEVDANKGVIRKI